MFCSKSLPMAACFMLFAMSPVLAAQDDKSTIEQRPDLTQSVPTGDTIPGTATSTPQSAGHQGSGMGSPNVGSSAPSPSSSHTNGGR